MAALRDDHDRLQARVRDMAAEIEGLRGDLFDVLRAANEAVEKIAEVGEDRGRLIGTLTNQLHDARLDLAHVRGDLSALKLALADQRAGKTAALDLDPPLGPRSIN